MKQQIEITPDKLTRMTFFEVVLKIKQLKKDGAQIVTESYHKGLYIFKKTKVDAKGKKNGFDEYFFIFGNCNIYFFCEILETKIKHNFPVMPTVDGFKFDTTSKNIIWKP